jgi:formamidopyrimidine-DNA glycosylase
MPELPEVETTRAGLAPHLEGDRVTAVEVRDGRLRWPVPDGLPQYLTGARLERLARRAKYLLFHFDRGILIGHLGMSGSMRLVDPGTALLQHDHVVLTFEGGRQLRLNDPRRFGSLHWSAPEALAAHFLMEHLGPEPLGEDFDGALLHQRSRGRRAPVKAFLMDARIVVGVGNIYANEALFRAGIHPRRAGRPYRPGTLRRARRSGPGRARRGGRHGGYDAPRLRRQRRQTGLLPTVARRLRSWG